MTWQWTPYTLPLALSAALSGCLAVYALRRRSVQGTLAAGVALLAICEWSATYALEMASATLAAKQFWSHLEYLGIVVTPAAWLCFVLAYTNRGHWLSRRNLALLSLEPIATVLVHLTNSGHNWMYTRVELARANGFWVQSVSYGPWFWVHAAYSYLLLLVGSLFLVQALQHSFYLYRWQASALLVAVLAPWVGNVLYVTGLSPFPNLDLTPFALALSSVALTWSLFRLRLADLVLVARAAVIESMGDGVVLLDAQDHVVRLNPAAQYWLGRRAQQAVGRRVDELWPDWSELLARLRAGGALGLEVEWSPAGDARTLGVRISPMLDWRGDLLGQVVVLRDISERRRAEEELRRLKEFNERLVLGMAEALILEDAHGLIIFVNPALCRLLGWSEAELLGQPWHKIVSAAEIAKVQSKTERRPSGFADQYETVLLAKDGREIPVLINARPLFQEGAFAGVLSACTEIGEVKRVEQELRASAARFRSVVQLANDGIMLVDSHWNIILWNHGAEAIFGYRADEVLGKPIQVVMQGSLGEARSADVEYLLSHAPFQSRKPVELEGVRKDGTRFPFELSFATWQTDEGPFYSGILRDISERKRSEEEREKLEQRLREAQKIEAVGLLAGGVAHEFNNLLTVILGNVELALMQSKAGQPVYQEMVSIQNMAQRAASLTQQLLAFGRRQMLQPRALDLNEAVRDFASIFERVLGGKVQMELDLAPELPPVFADAGALQQVLLNLSLNARDAMPEGGTLRLATAPATPDEECLRLHPEARPGSHLLLTISDTGVGMDEVKQLHLFEPFFTTKDVGQGPGLGLSVVYGIVAQHHGWIDVHSQVGQGTRFDIYLPVHAPARPPPDAPPPKHERRPAQTILVAEDEELLRDLVQVALESLGYDVLPAADGQQAVSLFQEDPQRVDLVILDMVMPRMTGPKAYSAMLAQRPNLPVLFITGYAVELSEPSFQQSGRAHLLRKPFDIKRLEDAVKQALNVTSES